jgi:hypothetical protein
MAVANTLAYYVMATIMAVKSFIVQAPGQQEGVFCPWIFVSILDGLPRFGHSPRFWFL